ncbi:SpoIIE family protein phosphatase [Fluviicola sp.]|uniref:SpoIIE family protein phosphatase n=1 Tax=Fluviicola sp. TaxID=1917219 RepID=UPI0031E2142F
MLKPLKILILEDEASDAELVKYHASTLDYACEFRHAFSEETFLQALNEFVPDIVLSDYKLNGYDGMRALERCNELLPFVPFVLVTGTLGEELAVKIIKQGASDFLLKGHLSNLPKTIVRVLREAEKKREAAKLQEERDLLFSQSIDLIGIAGTDGYFKTINPAFERTLGYSLEEILTTPYIEFIHPEDREKTLQSVENLQNASQPVSIVNRSKCKNGAYVWLEWHLVMRADLVFANARDMTERMRSEREILKLNQELEQKVEQRTQELSIVNASLLEKNREVTDSIHYAKRIQRAKIPRIEYLQNRLSECFVFFQPKDIVSGDFYYFHQTGETLFIAAADCTGHGVPGALLSMIAMEKLEDAFKNSSDPAEVLSLLNRSIKAAFQHKEDRKSLHDGLDIALCALNTTTGFMKFAGANRPLWIIRRGMNDIEEFKGTRKAIGGITHENDPFECHEIQLKKGDTCYMFSDGYADTFGGENDKKMMTRRFKDILLGIQEYTLDQHERLLEKHLHEWKKENGQTDDILVVGFRF